MVSLFCCIYFQVNAQEENSHKHAISVSVFSPLNNLTVITYEQFLKENRTFEVSLGAIGLGNHQKIDDTYYFEEIKANGICLKTNYKHIFPTFWRKKKSSLGGAYYALSLGYANFVESENYIVRNPNNTEVYYDKRNVQAFSMLFILGKQFVFKQRLLLNLFVGAGAVFDNRTGNIYYSKRVNDYIGRRYFEGDRISTTAGVSLGWAFN